MEIVDISTNSFFFLIKVTRHSLEEPTYLISPQGANKKRVVADDDPLINLLGRRH